MAEHEVWGFHGSVDLDALRARPLTAGRRDQHDQAAMWAGHRELGHVQVEEDLLIGHGVVVGVAGIGAQVSDLDAEPDVDQLGRQAEADDLSRWGIEAGVDEPVRVAGCWCIHLDTGVDARGLGVHRQGGPVGTHLGYGLLEQYLSFAVQQGFFERIADGVGGCRRQAEHIGPEHGVEPGLQRVAIGKDIVEPVEDGSHAIFLGLAEGCRFLKKRDHLIVGDLGSCALDVLHAAAMGPCLGKSHAGVAQGFIAGDFGRSFAPPPIVAYAVIAEQQASAHFDEIDRGLDKAGCGAAAEPGDQDIRIGKFCGEGGGVRHHDLAVALVAEPGRGAGVEGDDLDVLIVRAMDPAQAVAIEAAHAGVASVAVHV